MFTNYTVICPLRTLSGRELIYQAQLCPNVTQILAIEGGWNSDLDHCPLVIKDDPNAIPPATYTHDGQINSNDQNNGDTHWEKTASSLGELAQTTVLIAAQGGSEFKAMLRAHNIRYIQLGAKSTALEDFAKLHNIKLDQWAKALAVYHRDYLGGLSQMGIPAKPTWAFKAEQNPNSYTELRKPHQPYLQDILSAELIIEQNDGEWRILQKKQKDGELNSSSKHIRVRDYDKSNFTFSLVPDKYRSVYTAFRHYQNIKTKDCNYNKSTESNTAVKLPTELALFYHQNSELDTPPTINMVTGIEFSGDQRFAPLLDEVVNNPRWSELLNLGTLIGQHSVFLRVDYTQETDTENQRPPLGAQITNDLVDHLLGGALIDGRPLRLYKATFFFPFEFTGDYKPNVKEAQKKFDHLYQLSRENDLTEFKDRVKEIAENEAIIGDQSTFDYLIPTIREKLYSKKDHRCQSQQTLKEWRISSGNYYVVEKVVEEAVEKSVDNKLYANISDLRLYQFFNGIYLLGITLEPKYSIKPNPEEAYQPTFLSDGSDWWQDLIFSELSTYNILKQLQTSRWLSFTNQFRKLRKHFTVKRKYEPEKMTTTYDVEEEEKTSSDYKLRYLANTTESHHTNNESTNNKNISHTIDSLIGLFFDNTYPQAKIFDWHDYRMFANVAYGMPGQPIDSEFFRQEQHCLLSKAVYIDDYGFSKLNGYPNDPDFIRELLDSHLYKRWQGLGNTYGYTEYSNVYTGFGGFYCGDVFRHIFSIYERMLILSLFYKASMQHYERKVSSATRTLLGPDNSADEFRKMRGEFVKFSNLYWFETITEQVQGKEIFELQTNGLKIKQSYEYVKEQISWADDYLAAERAKADAARAQMFNQVAGSIAIFTVLLQAFTIFWNFDNEKFTLQSAPIFSGLITLLFGLSIFGYMMSKSRKVKSRRKMLMFLALLIPLSFGSYYLTEPMRSVLNKYNNSAAEPTRQTKESPRSTPQPEQKPASKTPKADTTTPQPQQINAEQTPKNTTKGATNTASEPVEEKNQKSTQNKSSPLEKSKKQFLPKEP